MRPLAFLVLGAAFADASAASATTWTVNSDASLRAALTGAANGDTINFTSSVTLSASNDLPAITTGLTIDGNGFTLNANGNRGFFAYSGTSSISDLTITGAIATGGAGGGGGGGGGAGGGGAGLGGGLFIAAAASVTTNNLQITSNEAFGGGGGSNSGSAGGGGGGGLGGAGGASTGGSVGGGGGGVGNIATGGTGGSGAAGIVTGATGGGAGSFTGGGSGGGGGSSGSGCCSGGGGVGGGNGFFIAGIGGFGGGGGGGEGGGGNGGFGGGAGGGYFAAGGNGGFGGGGGGITNGVSGSGGFGGGGGGTLVSGILLYAGGGGGAGLGGGIFVQQGGTLILRSGSIGGNSAVGGSGGASFAIAGTALNGGNGAAFGAGIFLQGNGALTFAPATATTLSIADAIADQNGVGGTGGAWGLKMNGLGTVQLGAANAYSGGTTIASGKLEITGAGTLGATSGSVTVSGGVLDLGGTTQTQNGGVTLSGGTIQNGTLLSFSNYALQSGAVSAILSGLGGVDKTTAGTVTLSGANTYAGATTINGGKLMGGANNAFSAASATTVNTGGALDLGGFGQNINQVFLSGGVIEHGALTSVSGITSNGGVLDGIAGATSLNVNAGVTTLDTTTGGNTYTGPTVIAGAGTTLKGGAANAFSAASRTTINAVGTLDLGGLAQTINTVNLAGGVIQNGVLFTANGITSTGGTFSQMTVSTSGTGGHALHVAGSGSQVNLVGSNTFTTQGAGAIGLYASLGGLVTATGATNVATSGGGAYGVNADGAGGQIKLASANVATAGFSAFDLFASDTSSSGAAGSISATGTLNLTTTDPATTAIELQGNGASIQATGGGTIAAAGNAIEFMGGTSQTATFDNFNIGTTSGNIVFADPSIATITFNNSTVNAGTGYLLDATAGSTVNFNADASTLTGAMATDATSTSNVNLTNGTVWNLTGPSNVSSLAVTNSVIVFAPPGTGGGFKTLTVGNYVGSGANITLNTALGGSSSPTDQIVVNGGTATGLTYLTIRNAGGLGAQTTGSGIPVVVTTNGGTTAPNAFALANESLVVGDYRYSLVDPGGDWYLVSQPTPTQQQVQSSLAGVTKAQLGQIVNNGLLSSILLGATQQVSCSSCASGFGALGSFALGTQGRINLSDRLTAIGGFSYNQWNSSGISVYDAPTVAGALLYDFDNLGSSRPFVEAGGSLTPYESVHGSRPYQNGPTMATGSWTSLDRNLSVFARAGWLARLTPIDEVAAYADLSRNWLDTGGYTEATTALNPYPASVSSGLQALNAARLCGQYTHLFGDKIEVTVSAAVARGFGSGNGPVVNVTDFGPIGPTGLPTSTWFEYSARIGYRLSDNLVADAFVLGAVGGEVRATAHGGIALRVVF